MASGHVRKRGKTWSYIFDLGKINGKRKQKEKGGFRTKKEAEVALRKALEEFESGGIIVKENKMSISDYLDYWMENYVKLNLKYRTCERYNTDIKNHIRPKLGHYYLQKINHIILQQFFTDKSKVLSKNMLNGLYGILSGAFNQAIKWGFIKINPLRMVVMPKQENNKEVITLKSTEIKCIVERIKNTQYYIPFIVALNTGMRAGEVTGLEWSDINFDTKTIQVTKILQCQNKEWVFTTPKTKSSIRNILMNDLLMQELKKWSIKQKENKLKYGPYYTENNFVCTKENGEYLTTDSLKYLSRIINKQLKIKFKFHYLRHTHATILLENGVHPKIVQERLGHSKISTTLDTYSHVSMNMQANAMDIFDTAIKSNLPT